MLSAGPCVPLSPQPLPVNQISQHSQKLDDSSSSCNSWSLIVDLSICSSDSSYFVISFTHPDSCCNFFKNHRPAVTASVGVQKKCNLSLIIQLYTLFLHVVKCHDFVSVTFSKIKDGEGKRKQQVKSLSAVRYAERPSQAATTSWVTRCKAQKDM